MGDGRPLVDAAIKRSIAAAKSCAGTRDLERGRAIHGEAIRLGYVSNPRVASSLIGMYGKCGSAVDARRVFDRVRPRDRDVVVWTAMILCYADNAEGVLGLDLFVEMLRDGFSPNSWTLVAVIKACSSLASNEVGKIGAAGDCSGMNSIDASKSVKMDSLEKGLAIHSTLLRAEDHHLDNIFVTNSLVNFYAKCGSMIDAARVFDGMKDRDAVSWNSLAMGYVDNGDPELALEVLSRWIADDDRGFGGFNHVSFVIACKACIGLAEKETGEIQDDGKIVKVLALEIGMMFHSQACCSGCSSQGLVASTLVDMYCKCRSMANARRVFEGIICGKNTGIDLVVPWTSIELGYVDNGEPDSALELFRSMVIDRGLAPNCRTYVAVLKASCGCLDQVKNLHGMILRSGNSETDLLLGNCLIDAYGKSGSMIDARIVFDAVPARDSVTWTSLLAGYSLQSDARFVFDLFRAMQDERCRPNAVTLLCVLAACCRSGMVEESRRCLEDAVARFGIEPGIEHFSCLADLLGRAGEVEAMMESMPRSVEKNAVTWTMLLDACRKWKNVAAGEIVFEKMMESSCKRSAARASAPAAAYDLMANLYVGST